MSFPIEQRPEPVFQRYFSCQSGYVVRSTKNAILKFGEIFRIARSTNTLDGAGNDIPMEKSSALGFPHYKPMVNSKFKTELEGQLFAFDINQSHLIIAYNTLPCPALIMNELSCPKRKQI